MNVAELKTAGGHPMGEAASALQKCIRRGLEEEAVYWAQELDSRFQNYVWKRLLVIAHEDIGVADQQAVLFVDLCYRQHQWFLDRGTWEYFPLINAVLALCRAKKTRAAAELGTLIYDDPTYTLEVPDFAVDQHTPRGKRMGRGVEHFVTEGCQISNAIPSPYTERALSTYAAFPERVRDWVKDRVAAVRSKAKLQQGKLFE